MRLILSKPGIVQIPGPFFPKSSLTIWASPSKTAAICLRDRFVDSASCLNISDFVRPLGDFFTVMAAPSRNVDTETNLNYKGEE